MKKIIVSLCILFALFISSICLFPHWYINCLARVLTKNSTKPTTVHVSNGFLNPLSGTLSLSKITVRWGDLKSVLYNFEAQNVLMELNSSESFKNRFPVFEQATFSSITAHISDGTIKEVPGDGGPLPHFAVKKAEVKESKFTYTSTTAQADFNVTDVAGNILDFTSRPTSGEERVTIQLGGKVTGSGTFSLDCGIDLFRSVNKDVIVLKVQNHDLTSMNSFFEKESSLRLKGFVHSSTSDFHLSQGHLTGRFSATYDNFEMNFMNSPKKSAIMAFLENLFASIILNEENEKGQPKSVKIEARRKPEESVFQLLLRGLKASAMKLATGGSK